MLKVGLEKRTQMLKNNYKKAPWFGTRSNFPNVLDNMGIRPEDAETWAVYIKPVTLITTRDITSSYPGQII